MKNHKAKALELILNERARQIEEEGYTAEQDDRWGGHQLMIAGVCYERDPNDRPESIIRKIWPWEVGESWKPTAHLGPAGRIRELVKAGALYTAELERLKRISQSPCRSKNHVKRRINRVVQKLALLLESGGNK